MMVGFVIWTAVAIAIAVIGIIAGRSGKPSGFFAGVNPPEVNDVVKYNHSVGTLWVVYAVLLELFGVPLLFWKQNSAGFVISILGVVFISIGLVIAYTFILAKYRK
ncbi:MAG: hypothetical protein J6W85_05870 [Lachnospiraceae bacterium]|nr:hypothetical protein [Lachnospiraceae bacterium]